MHSFLISSQRKGYNEGLLPFRNPKKFHKIRTKSENQRVRKLSFFCVFEDATRPAPGCSSTVTFLTRRVKKNNEKLLLLKYKKYSQKTKIPTSSKLSFSQVCYYSITRSGLLEYS